MSSGRERRPEHRRMPRCAPFSALVLLLVVAVACGGGSKPAEKTGDHFLLANQSALSEATPAGISRALIKFDDASYLLDPAVSPDGQRLAFARQTPAKSLPNGAVDFGSDLYVADREGKNAKEVLHHAAIAEFIRSPAWLSSTQLLITVEGQTPDKLPDFRTEILDLGSGSRRRLIDGAINAALSPDGKQIVYVNVDPLTQEESLIATDKNVSAKRTLAAGNSGLGLFTSPVFSPDARSVTFAAVDLNAPAIAPTPKP